MVNFTKQVNAKSLTKKLSPIEIYETLDRASDKGPLRPAQETILSAWDSNFKDKQNVILKLHTGQGKTLVGLLILQAKLNAGHGPALYLCPNNYLIEQTCTQAKQFGFKYCVIDDDLPEEFLDSQAILITSIQKLFNGFTKFGLGPKYTRVASIVLDDAHACLDSIRSCFTIRVEHGSNLFSEILSLFSTELMNQGAGTYEEIKAGNFEAFLPVPYWDWQDKHADIVRVLSKHAKEDGIKFAWPLLKDALKQCLCIVSGAGIEIAPYTLPLNRFGSFYNASHRVFMSATVNDDSFFIKALGVSPETVANPLRYSAEKWSGERMVLIPSLIDDSLAPSNVVARFAKFDPPRKYGVVALTPSFDAAKLWEHNGAVVANKNTIQNLLLGLRTGSYAKTLVIVNRYDGIDLPDDMCRILVFDRKPFSEDLIDRYYEMCRADSEIIQVKLAQIIEQGMGRHIRGEKDYGVVVLVGTKLIRAVRSKGSRRFLSPQTRQQIEIGLEVAELAKQEISEGKEARDVLTELINQCLGRDEGWKQFYISKMNQMEETSHSEKVLAVFSAEKAAEEFFNAGKVDQAIAEIQKLLDGGPFSREEQGWYLQEMARYKYAVSKLDSNDLQLHAHEKNPYLLKPKDGMKVITIEAIGQKRIERIIRWIGEFSNFEELSLMMDEIFDGLQFGVASDRFELSLHRLGQALGYVCQRPDKEWKAGPDNLWALREGEFLIIECKNMVHVHREEIYKEETGQMNNAIAWFDDHYPGATSHSMMIIPTKKLGSAAGFSKSVQIMRPSKLTRLRDNVRKFFREFEGKDLRDVSEAFVGTALKAHSLETDDLMSDTYTEPATKKFGH